MSTFPNNRFSDGEAIRATTLNTKLGTGMENAVNDLDGSSIERYALDTQHLPSLSMTDIFSNGYEATSPSAAGGLGNEETYGNTLPPTGSPATYPYTYQTFDTNPGSVVAIGIYGPCVTGTSTHAGWRIPAYQNNASVAGEIALASATNFTTAGIKGVLCEASVEPFEAADIFRNGIAPITHEAGLNSLAIAIGWEDGLGTRHVVERSVRFYSMLAAKKGNASTMTFLTQADLAAGDGQCAKIFMVVASCRPGLIASENAGRTSWTTQVDTLEIKHYNLSVLPLQAGDL